MNNKVLIAAMLAALVMIAACGEEDDGGGSGGSSSGGAREIAISRGGTDIPNGSDDALGSVAFGIATPVTYTVANTGGSTLTLTGIPAVATSLTSNCTATVTSQPSTPLAGGTNDTFTIDLTVTAAGAFGFTVSVPNDDADEGTFSFTVSGTGATVPEINIQRSSVNVPDGSTDAAGAGFSVGLNAALTWTIQNTGLAALNLTGAPDVATASLSNCTLGVTQPSTSTIAASSSTTFMIAITVLSGGAFSFDVSIANDDSDENPYNFTVTGSATASNPEIEVFTEFADLTSGSPAFWKSVAPTSFTAFPLMVRNTGTTNLNISATIIQSQNNCTVTVRENPPASVAPDDTTAFTVLVEAPASGNFDFTVRISSDDADEGAFDAFIQASTVPSTHVLLTTNTANGMELISATYPGAATRVTMNNAMTAGASGVQSFHHLGDRVLYTVNLTPGGPTNVFFRSTLAAGGTNTNISSTQTGASGFIGAIKFADQDDFVFTASTGTGPTRLYSVTISGTTVGSATEINGALPGGAPTGVGTSDFWVSPRRDQVAFMGDMLTAGTNELFLVPFGGGTRTRISAPLTGGRTILGGIAVWLPDQSGVLYQTAIGGLERELWLARIGSTPVKLNGTVPSGNVGVLSLRVATSANRVFFTSMEGGNLELYSVYIPASGTPAAAVALNGGTAPGSGIGMYAFNLDGTRVLFTADSGTASAIELYRTTYTLGTPTTTKSVAVTSGPGVQIEPVCFSTKTMAWYLHADVSASRYELFSADLSSGFTSARLLNAPTGPGLVINAGYVVLHPNGVNVVFMSDQGNPGLGTAVFRATLGTASSGARLNLASTKASLLNLIGNRVYFERDTGGSGGQTTQTMLFTAAQGTETQLVTTNTVQIRPHSTNRVFVSVFGTTGPDSWISSDAAGTAATVSNPAQSPGDLKSGVETRP